MTQMQRRPPAPGRRTGVWSLAMLLLAPVAYVAAYLAGTGLGALLGLEEGEMLGTAGPLGYLAGVALIALLCAPQIVGIWLGRRARRAGAARLGLAGLVANALVALYVVVTGLVGLVAG
jgi:hypothetical protein